MPIHLNRRQLLAAAALSTCLPARAGAWPDKPIRLVVPSAPTTPGDYVARALADLLQARTGQPVIVDNRSGAQGLIGLEVVAKSAPDGYTFGLLNIQQTIVPAMRPMPFKLASAFQPVVQLTTEATVLVVGSALPVTDVAGLLELLRRNPGKYSYGSSGNGSPSHVGMELLRRAAGVDIMHVPYRSPAAVITDMAGGQLQLALLNSNAVLQALPTGKLRALAVSSRERLPRLAQVPTFQEAGLRDVDLRGWVGLVAPAGTDPSIVSRMNAEVNAVLEMPAAQERLRFGGSEPAGGTVKQFADHVDAETQRWAKVVAAAHIRMD